MSEPKENAKEEVTPKESDELDLDELEKVAGGAATTTDLRNDPKFKEAIKLGMK